MKADRSIYINDTSKCAICEKPSLFVIEWYGVDQYGKNPELVDDRGVCGSFEHLVHASRHEEYGGVPDAIFLKYSNKKQSELLNAVLEISYPKNAKQALEKMIAGEELLRKIKIKLSAEPPLPLIDTF